MPNIHDHKKKVIDSWSKDTIDYKSIIKTDKDTPKYAMEQNPYPYGLGERGQTLMERMHMLENALQQLRHELNDLRTAENYERDIRQRNPAVRDAWERYQIVRKMVECG